MEKIYFIELLSDLYNNVDEIVIVTSLTTSQMDILFKLQDKILEYREIYKLIGE